MKKLLIITACPSGGLAKESEADSNLASSFHGECETRYKGYKIPGLLNWDIMIFKSAVIQLDTVIGAVQNKLSEKQYDCVRHYNTGHGVEVVIDGKKVRGLWWGDPKYFIPFEQLSKELYQPIQKKTKQLTCWFDNCYAGGAKQERNHNVTSDTIAPKDFQPIVKAITLPDLDMAVMEDVVRKAGEQPDIESVYGMMTVCRKKETAFGRLSAAPGNWLTLNTQDNSLGTWAWFSAVDCAIRNRRLSDWGWIAQLAQKHIGMIKDILPYPSELKVHHLSVVGNKSSSVI